MTTIDGQLAVVGGVRSTVTTRYAEQYLVSISMHDIYTV